MGGVGWHGGGSLADLCGAASASRWGAGAVSGWGAGAVRLPREWTGARDCGLSKAGGRQGKQSRAPDALRRTGHIGGGSALAAIPRLKHPLRRSSSESAPPPTECLIFPWKGASCMLITGMGIRPAPVYSTWGQAEDEEAQQHRWEARARSRKDHPRLHMQPKVEPRDARVHCSGSP